MNISEESKLIKKVMFIMVMEEESSNVLEQHKFIKDEIFTDVHKEVLQSFTLLSNGLEIILVRPVVDPLHKTSCFGTEISFLLTYLGIQHYKPCLVVNMGYAGYSLNDNKYKLGDVIVAAEKSLYHRREMIIEFFKNTNEGHYPLFKCSNLVNQLNFYFENVGTANSFIYKDHVAISKNVPVVEMELCSVARASYYFGTPCIGVKIISDSVNEEDTKEKREKEFLESLFVLKNKFKETFNSLIEYFNSKTLSEL